MGIRRRRKGYGGQAEDGIVKGDRAEMRFDLRASAFAEASTFAKARLRWDKPARQGMTTAL